MAALVAANLPFMNERWLVAGPVAAAHRKPMWGRLAELVLLYFVVGVGVLGLGFLALDLLTPGNLRSQVYTQRKPNAAILLGANHLALAVIVTTAIMTSSDSLLQGLVEIARCVVCLRQGAWPSREQDVEEVDVDKLKALVTREGEPPPNVGPVSAAGER